MIRGLYTGASGLRLQMTRLGILGNNLANASTPGYKQDVDAVASFPQLLLSRIRDTGQSIGLVGPVGTGAGLREETLDLRQGHLVDTAKPLDLALVGPGFFAVQTPEGVRYTRDGSFSRDSNGQLVTAQGYPVLGETGPITLPDGDPVVKPDGTIAVNNQPVARLRLLDFPQGTELKKTGDNLLTADGATPATQASVSQFTLEASNFDPVNGMIDLMAASRAYETNQRLLQIQDQTLERAVNDVGRV